MLLCPTYNNTSPEDSGDYSLALRLTDNYHNELINDLIPAVEGKYSTYAEDTTPKRLPLLVITGLSAAAFQWVLWQLGAPLNTPSTISAILCRQGGPAASTETYESVIKNSGYEWDDFFIFAASGTNDFAYSGFKNGIEAMREKATADFSVLPIMKQRVISITLNLTVIIRDITLCSTFTMDCAGYGGDKMKYKQVVKLIIDIAMYLIFVALMQEHLWDGLHEWLGITLFALFIAHTILNFRWYQSLFKGKYIPTRTI